MAAFARSDPSVSVRNFVLGGGGVGDVLTVPAVTGQGGEANNALQTDRQMLRIEEWK